MENISFERLERLKDEMIKTNLDELDFNSDEEKFLSYEKLLYKTIVDGKFDNIFLSEYLDDLDSNERQKVISLARNHKELCFFHGDFNNWADSVEGVTLSDPNLVSEILLNNYDYLIRLAKNGGEDVLNFLDKFKGNELFDDGSIIALLRRNFADDDVLEEILIEMSKDDGKYKDFNNTQKVILCNYPEGVLYKVDDDKRVDIVDPKILKMHIQKKFIGSYDFDVSNIESNSFDETVSILYSEYNIEKNNIHIR